MSDDTKTEQPAEPKVSRSVFNQERYKYNANGVRTAAGRKSVDCGDPVAEALRGLDADAVVNVVAENGGQVKPTWAALNPGLRRMTASNVLRGLYNRNKRITVQGKEVVAPASKASAEAAPDNA